ncbi:MAG: MFS transporter [Promethearchaeota archaeon]
MFKKIKEIFIAPDIDEKFRVPFSIKIKFAIGFFGFNLSAGLVAAWLMNFYIKIVQIDPLLWGLAWILYFIWNSVNDPLIGYLSDRTRTRFGRRVPYLMISTPLIAVGFILMFFPPILDPTLPSSQIIYFFWLFLSLMVYDTFYTILGLCSGALISELTIEPEERASLNFFGAVGGGLGMVLTFIVPFLLIINEDPYSQNLHTIQMLVLIFAIIGSLCLIPMTFGIKEKKEFCFAEEEPMGFVESIKYTINNKAFLIYTAFAFCIVYIQVAIYSQISFFIQDVLEINGTDIFSSAPILFFVGASLLGFPLGIIFNQKFGGKKALIYLSILVIIGLTLITFSTTIMMANIALFIMGLGYAGSALIIPVLLCDIIDKDELETGYRREGAYFGSGALFTKPAQSVAAFLTGFILAITGYDASRKNQDALAKFGIKLNIGLIPAIFVLVSVIILIRFPIDGSTEEYKQMKKQIEALHDKKLSEFKKSLEES